MRFPALLPLLLTLCATSLAAPDHIIEERRIVEVYQKRQADLGQLLQLASLAGISALPTDPAVLLSLGPFANSLAAQLPTSSVLSVLLTAAPSGFISSIVNDPSFASSFESDFQKGSSPGWFNSLPTDVKSYLHTYSGFGAAATVAEGVKSEVSQTGAVTGSQTGTGTGATTATVTGATTTGAGSTGVSASATSTGSGASETNSASSETGGSSSVASAVTGPASSLSSGGGGPAAAQPTGAMVAGVAAFAGIFGVVPWV